MTETGPRRIVAPDPAWSRRVAVLNAITDGLRPGSPVLYLRRHRAAEAVLEGLADGGWLAPLPGERDQRLTAFLAAVETALNQKGGPPCPGLTASSATSTPTTSPGSVRGPRSFAVTASRWPRGICW